MKLYIYMNEVCTFVHIIDIKLELTGISFIKIGK